MNSSANAKRNKSRSTISSHNNSTNIQNINSKSQLRQKPTNERTVTPEGVYFNGRVMHATTSLVGCLVQVEVKDGTKYEGVLKCFSPDFEIVIESVIKIEPNLAPMVGTNIGNLLASLQANNRVSPTLIFKFPDIVKLNASNVDLDFATSKGHMTDSEISRFDSRQLTRDKELIPWEPENVECGDSLEDLEDHNNGTTAQNGWSPDDMFKTNAERFNVRSTFDSSLKDYTMPLVKGEGEDYEQRQAQAEKIANEIEGDSMRTDRYAKEDADDEERYSAVVRPNNENIQHNRHGSSRNRKPNNAQSSGNYNANSSGSSGSRSNRSSNVTLTASSPPFHTSNKNSSNTSYNKQQFSNSSSINSPTNTSPSYQTHNKSQATQQSYREDVSEAKAQYAGVAASYGNQMYSSKADAEETPPHSPHVHSNAPPNQNPLPQRNINENRRGLGSNKRKEEVAADLKKFSNDFKLPSNVETSKENVNLKSDPHIKNSNISAKSKSPVESTPVKDKSETINESNDKELSEKTIETASPLSPTIPPESKTFKLNPNAKSFTPRSPLTPVNTSSTPPSVASTPSSTVSSVHMTPHMAPHPPQHHHHLQQQQHPQQPRFSNPIVQLQPQYNVLPPGLTLPLAPQQYAVMTAMTPTFAQSNANQQRSYRSKGPQQYTNHGVRHDFTQQSAHVAAAVTGHPVLATAPIAAPQQIPVSYAPQQTGGMVTQQGPPQAMYQHMYQSFHPRMNVLPSQAAAMGMAAMQHAVQYDPSQLQHLYSAGTVQLQHLVSHAQQHVTNSGPHSAPSTPQSGTPTTPLHGGPAPSPVHHQPNQPPTPTPSQTVMYASVASPHNQSGNVGHNNSGQQFHQQLVLMTSGQVAAANAHHQQGHGGPIHAHALSHSSTPGNPHGGPPLMPVQLISSNAAQNALAATFNHNHNPGV